MAKKSMLALPAQAKQDVKTVAGILDRWTTGVEDLTKDVFSWAKRHKFLIILAVGAVAFYRYWLMEPEDSEESEDFS